MRIYGYNNKNMSVKIAKHRLKNLLISDRVNCTPDTFSKIRIDLFRTLSKYLDLSEDCFDVKVTRTHIYIKLTGDEE